VPIWGYPNDKYVACSMGVLEVGNVVACKGRHGGDNGGSFAKN